ncbi:MAG: type II toxin-antitoxin system PemK/MazF family toxin [Ignavibacteriae bacterium]|nr:type II toxin-antitoxin system PemK/MazF family toxin [Ignavibacteriota bacterium]
MYKQREVVLVPFPYSDLSAVKKRPVLIVSNNEYNQRFEDVVVCVITSSRFKDSYSLNLEDAHLEMGVLPESSIIKTHKLFTVHKSKILRKFSLIRTELFEQVTYRITELITPK